MVPGRVRGVNKMEQSKIKKVLKLYDTASYAAKSPVDRALWHMLKRWEDKLPEMLPDDPEWFHRAFRQVDVLPTGNEDMVVYCLLINRKMFWEIFNKVISE